MQIGRIDLNKLRGLSGKGLGFGKEAIGVVFGNVRLQREGQAQQERATEELKALSKQLEAERKDAEAEVHETRQKVAQRAKSD
jgi:cell division protein FtsB